MCASPLSGKIELQWPTDGRFAERATYLSCGNSADTGLPDQSLDLVVTDPPFFDNVHYSELADFFHAWRQLTSSAPDGDTTTRSPAEVQDADADSFAAKLQAVFRECHRVLKDDGLLVFTYHHSRDEGWTALAEAVLGAGFSVVNSQPVKAEMSVAAPKSQAKEPIQLDIIIVCRKGSVSSQTSAHRYTGDRVCRRQARTAESGRVLAVPQRSQDCDVRPVINDAHISRGCGPLRHLCGYRTSGSTSPPVANVRPPAQLTLFD